MSDKETMYNTKIFNETFLAMYNAESYKETLVSLNQYAKSYKLTELTEFDFVRIMPCIVSDEILKGAVDIRHRILNFRHIRAEAPDRRLDCEL